MPTLAMEAVEKVEREHPFDNLSITHLTYLDEFMKLLDQKIGEAKDMLLERFEWICSQSPASAKFMYENNVMAGYVPEEGIRSALKHGTLAVG
jgi:ribonucleoside-triphosphate reductase